jgi:hypothetical protein
MPRWPVSLRPRRQWSGDLDGESKASDDLASPSSIILFLLRAYFGGIERTCNHRISSFRTLTPWHRKREERKCSIN